MLEGRKEGGKGRKHGDVASTFRRRTDLSFIHVFVKACAHEWMEGWMDGGMEGWRDKGMEGWKDGRMDGWKDGWMDAWRGAG